MKQNLKQLKWHDRFVVFDEEEYKQTKPCIVKGLKEFTLGRDVMISCHILDKEQYLYFVFQ